MDFLKNLKLEDNRASDSQQNSRGLFDKIDKFAGALNGSSSHTAPQSTPPPAAQAKPQRSGGLLGKIGSAIAEHHNQSSSPPPAAPPTAPKHEGLLGKIGGVLGGENYTTSAPPPAAPKHEGLLGKVSSVLSSNTQQPVKQDESLLGKLGGVLTGSHQTQAPPKPQGLSGKINHVLGGGAAGEQKEDALDKAIDFVQEHVLGAGPQKNESALEQMKDKQIANMIRGQYQKATGHEFPIKEKK